MRSAENCSEGFVQNLRVKKDTDRKISGKRLSSHLPA
jgi:hypothetical protein